MTTAPITSVEIELEAEGDGIAVFIADMTGLRRVMSVQADDLITALKVTLDLTGVAAHIIFLNSNEETVVVREFLPDEDETVYEVAESDEMFDKPDSVPHQVWNMAMRVLHAHLCDCKPRCSYPF